MDFKNRLVKRIRNTIYGKDYPPRAGYYSQNGQDQFLAEKLFKGRQNGLFIDIGANDGTIFSNTYYLEKNMGWTGFCFEPNPAAYARLIENRECTCIKCGVADFSGRATFLNIEGRCEMLSGLIDKYDPHHIARIEKELKLYGGKKEKIEIECVRLKDILGDRNIQYVDYLSIDTEGSELDILKSIDFEHTYFGVISVENNYDDGRIRKYMRSKNFKFIAVLSGDEFYINRTGRIPSIDNIL